MMPGKIIYERPWK